jgi:hypothetical protein
VDDDGGGAAQISGAEACHSDPHVPHLLGHRDGIIEKAVRNKQKGGTQMRIIENLANRMSIAGELLQSFWESKWWWLTPMIFILLFAGVLIILSQSSAIAPFIYTLF